MQRLDFIFKARPESAMTQEIFHRPRVLLPLLLAALFLIPSLPAVAQEASSTGPMARPWIGVVLADSDPRPGVQVRTVLRRGPAHASGLQDGDRILSVNGEPVRTTGKLQTLLGGQPVGRQVHLEILRGEESLNASVHIEASPASSEILRGHLLGFPLPSIQGLQTLDGESIDLSARAGVQVLDFWATWCTVCRQVTRELEAALHDAPGSFEVLSITSEDRGTVRTHLQTRPRALPVALDTNQEVHDALMVTTYPTVVVLGADGSITHIATGLQQVRDILPSITGGSEEAP